MSIPRGLSSEEQKAWARLAQSVTPLEGRSVPKLEERGGRPAAPEKRASEPKRRRQPAPALQKQAASRPASRARFSSELDSHWNRRLKSGRVAPDYTLDLHGHNLDTAYSRIIDGLDQARAMGARVVLVIAGRERPVDPADRASRRGAIRAKLLDWLAASDHADAIVAVRRAHIRHGGEGALYLVLKR